MLHWLRKLFSRRNAETLYLQARRYDSGDGVPRSKVQALKHLILAAEAGHPHAQNKLGMQLRIGFIGSIFSYDEEQAVPSLQKEALYWFEKSANQGNREGIKNLGLMLIHGSETEQSRGLACLMQAADSGSIDARFFLGQAYSNGWGVSIDRTVAASHYKIAAEKGHEYAQGILAASYESGDGLPINFHEALKWYQLAAEQGHPDSMFRLAQLYDEGTLVPQDYSIAIKWYGLAASKLFGDEKIFSCERLSELYRIGSGVERNEERAAYWSEKAKAERDLRTRLAIRFQTPPEEGT